MPERRPSKATSALKRRVTELFEENPYGASYRTIAQAITAEGTDVGKDVIGSIVQELKLKEHPPQDMSPSPPIPLRDSYHWTPSPKLNPREIAANQREFERLERLKIPLPPPYMQYSTGALSLNDDYAPPKKTPPPPKDPNRIEWEPYWSDGEDPRLSQWIESDYYPRSSILEPHVLRHDAKERRAARQAGLPYPVPANLPVQVPTSVTVTAPESEMKVQPVESSPTVECDSVAPSEVLPCLSDGSVSPYHSAVETQPAQADIPMVETVSELVTVTVTSCSSVATQAETAPSDPVPDQTPTDASTNVVSAPKVTTRRGRRRRRKSQPWESRKRCKGRSKGRCSKGKFTKGHTPWNKKV